MYHTGVITRTSPPYLMMSSVMWPYLIKRAALMSMSRVLCMTLSTHSTPGSNYLTGTDLWWVLQYYNRVLSEKPRRCPLKFIWLLCHVGQPFFSWSRTEKFDGEARWLIVQFRYSTAFDVWWEYSALSFPLKCMGINWVLVGKSLITLYINQEHIKCIKMMNFNGRYFEIPDSHLPKLD